MALTLLFYLTIERDTVNELSKTGVDGGNQRDVRRNIVAFHAILVCVEKYLKIETYCYIIAHYYY